MLKGEDFFKDTSDDFSSGGSSSSFGGIPTERVPMIEKVFQEVLGRKPSSRELAYYKYGVIKEEGIRAKLLKSEEHRKIVESASKLPSVENELKSVRLSEIKLQKNIEDIKLEMLESQKLLNEKNFLIKDLRESVSNPYDLPTQIEKFEEGFDVYTSKDRVGTVSSKKRTFKEVLIELIDIIFK